MSDMLSQMKKEAGKSGTLNTVVTNVYPLKVMPNVPYYKYDIRMHAIFKTKDGGEKTLELTKQTRDE